MKKLNLEDINVQIQKIILNHADKDTELEKDLYDLVDILNEQREAVSMIKEMIVQ